MTTIIEDLEQQVKDNPVLLYVVTSSLSCMNQGNSSQLLIQLRRLNKVTLKDCIYAVYMLKITYLFNLIGDIYV